MNEIFWDRYSHKKLKSTAFEALKKNINYRNEFVLGVPASYLDPKEFYHDAPFLKDSPYLTVLIENPNHIGCHTLVQSEDVFAGTQQIERELISICSEQILRGESGKQDGYVAPGGTESNIQAMWVYRNFYMKESGAKHDEIALIYSKDSHYSMPKGANILNLKSLVIDVDQEDRSIVISDLEEKVENAKANGIKHFIVVMNLATTMFGSVDDIKAVCEALDKSDVDYKVHVDAAFGGFIYPFTNPDSVYNFQNTKINSFTLDAHKMLQAPYGTGIFIIRKGYMKYALTEEANYVQGKDYTICGSRSGANAVAIWLILRTHGSDGWRVKMIDINDRTERLCDELDRKGIEFYRNPFVNIVAIKSKHLSPTITSKYHLVPDTHEGHPNWWKVVVMDHVRQGVLDQFVAEI